MYSFISIYRTCLHILYFIQTSEFKTSQSEKIYSHRTHASSTAIKLKHKKKQYLINCWLWIKSCAVDWIIWRWAGHLLIVDGSLFLNPFCWPLSRLQYLMANRIINISKNMTAKFNLSRNPKVGMQTKTFWKYVKLVSYWTNIKFMYSFHAIN